MGRMKLLATWSAMFLLGFAFWFGVYMGVIWVLA